MDISEHVKDFTSDKEKIDKIIKKKSIQQMLYFIIAIVIAASTLTYVGLDVEIILFTVIVSIIVLVITMKMIVIKRWKKDTDGYSLRIFKNLFVLKNSSGLYNINREEISKIIVRMNKNNNPISISFNGDKRKIITNLIGNLEEIKEILINLKYKIIYKKSSNAKNILSIIFSLLFGVMFILLLFRMNYI